MQVMYLVYNIKWGECHMDPILALTNGTFLKKIFALCLSFSMRIQIRLNIKNITFWQMEALDLMGVLISRVEIWIHGLQVRTYLKLHWKLVKWQETLRDVMRESVGKEWSNYARTRPITVEFHGSINVLLPVWKKRMKKNWIKITRKFTAIFFWS